MSIYFYRILLLLPLIFLQYSTIAQRPVIVWQKSFGGSGDDKVNDVLVNSDGSTVAVGYSTSNDGDINGHHGSTAYTDALVAKLDANGNLLWQKSLGGDYNDAFNNVIATADGGYLCVGYSYINTPTSTLPENYEANFYIVKLNSAGLVVWEKNFGGTKYDAASNAVLTSDGGFAIIGTAYSTDGNVLSGSATRIISDAWVIKINATGTLLWEKCLEYGTKDNAGAAIFESPDQNLLAYISGSSSYQYTDQNGALQTVFENPGIVYSLDKSTGNSSFKINTGGDADFSMCKVYGKYYFAYKDFITDPVTYPCINKTNKLMKAPADFSSLVSTNEVSYIYCLGDNASSPKLYFSSRNALAAWPDSSVVVAGHSDYSYRSSTLYPAVLYFSGTGITYNYGSDGYRSDFGNISGNYGGAQFNTVKVFAGGNDFIAAGSAYGLSADDTVTHAGNDCWVVHLANPSKITGNVFIDANGNGLKDLGEAAFNTANINFQKNGLAYTTVQPQNGSYKISPDTGTYFVSIQIVKPYYTSTNTGTFAAITKTYNQIDTVNFPVRPIPGIKDYGVNVLTSQQPHLGIQQTFNLNYFNKGTDTLINKPVLFIKDSRSVFSGAVPPVSSISGDTLLWNINNLLPDSSGQITIQLTMDSMPQLMNGDSVRYIAYIDSTGDISLGDNRFLLNQKVVGSFAIGYKEELHGGNIATTDMIADQYLTYTIYFQNAGNEFADAMVIRDTLDLKLNYSTLETLSSSHLYSFELIDGKYAVWTFGNIYLFDSASNPEQSKGYITYRIKPLPGYIPGDSIRNTAFIYLQNNPPVSTNTQITSFLDKCVWTGTISGEWEDRHNWACGKVPDKNTDVYINSGTPYVPIINSAAFCRIIHIGPGVFLTVNAGKSLTAGAY